MIFCDCTCGQGCPLGKTGMDRRCSLEELKQVIVRLKADLSSTNRVSQHNAMELQKASRELQALKYVNAPPTVVTQLDKDRLIELEEALKEALFIGLDQKRKIARLEAILNSDGHRHFQEHHVHDPAANCHWDKCSRCAWEKERDGK